jgi:hypothetical protein
MGYIASPIPLISNTAIVWSLVPMECGYFPAKPWFLVFNIRGMGLYNIL